MPIWHVMAERPQIVVIDDETGSRESVAIALEKTGLVVRTFDDARRALELLEREPSVRVAICDLRMPGMDGLAFLQEVRRRELELAVVLMTAFGSIESAVDAMKVGADDYLTKPVDLYELRRRVTNLLENRRLRDEVSSLQERLDKRFRFEAILGRARTGLALERRILRLVAERLTRLQRDEVRGGAERPAEPVGELGHWVTEGAVPARRSGLARGLRGESARDFVEAAPLGDGALDALRVRDRARLHVPAVGGPEEREEGAVGHVSHSSRRSLRPRGQ